MVTFIFTGFVSIKQINTYKFEFINLNNTQVILSQKTEIEIALNNILKGPKLGYIFLVIAFIIEGLELQKALQTY